MCNVEEEGTADQSSTTEELLTNADDLNSGVTGDNSSEETKVEALISDEPVIDDDAKMESDLGNESKEKKDPTVNDCIEKSGKMELSKNKFHHKPRWFRIKFSQYRIISLNILVQSQPAHE